MEGEEVQEIELPAIFQTPFRPDVIKRAVLASRSARRQKYGRDVRAGKRTSAENWGPGRGVARVPRIKGSGHPAGSKAAFAPMTVGGRITHPPVASRNFKEKINDKERRLAIRSAIAASIDYELVEYRGHIVDQLLDIPLILEDDFSRIKSTSEVRDIFLTFGLIPDINKARSRTSKVRSGQGKKRGRKYKNAKSALIVYHKNEGIYKAARNLPGVDVCRVDQLNAELLAPGTHAGRMTVWTQSAVKELEDMYK